MFRLDYTSIYTENMSLLTASEVNFELSDLIYLCCHASLASKWLHELNDTDIHKCSFESLSPKVLKDISFLFFHILLIV